MATTGWRNPGTAANDSSVGNAAWSNPGNAADGSNGTESTTASMGAGQTSQILRVTNFGFSAEVPSGATIDGIEVRYTRRRVQTAGNQVRDLSFRLRKSAGLVGDEKAATGTNWPNSLTLVTRGTSTDPWGTSWSDSDINDSGFGMELRCQRTGGTIQGAVGYIQIRVHYTEAAGPTEYFQAAAGSVTPSGRATKATTRLYQGVVTFFGAHVKRTSRALAGSTVVSGALITAKLVLRVLSGAITATGTAAKSVSRRLQGSATLAGALSLTKSFVRAVSGSFIATGRAVKESSKALFGTITATGLAATTKIFIRLLDGAITATGALSKTTAKALSGTATTTGRMVKATAKGLSGAITALGAAVTSSVRFFSLAGSTTPAGSVAPKSVFGLATAGVVTVSGAVKRLTARVLAGAATATGSLTRAIAKSFSGSVTSSGGGAPAVGMTHSTGGTLTIAGLVDGQPIDVEIVATVFSPSKNIYALSSATGLVKWVDYLPVKVENALKRGSYDDDGCLHVTALANVEGLIAWVDYIPVHVVSGGKRWRYDDDGYIPVNEV